MIRFNEIIDLLKENNLFVESNVKNDDDVFYISYDSKDIKDKTLFFCKGIKFKEEYLLEALKQGANLYISEKKYNDSLYIIVNDIRKAMSLIAIKFYDYAFKKIGTVGITGTKGKTTITYFLKNILDEYTKSKVGVISTVETYTGKRHEESHLTTPEALDLNKYFNEMVESNIKYLVMEVSSQAYKTDRVYGITFDYAMFLNISEDHISNIEHPNFKDYLDCKIKLLENSKNVIVNIDTDEFDYIMNKLKDKNVILYGTNNKADYYYENVIKENNGFSFDVKNDKINYSCNFRINMQGRFNIENATAAVTMAKLIGIDDESIKRGLYKTSVAGRMNVFYNNGITVIVDYAHNEISFKKLYESIKLDYPNRKIISVGGGPGGKAHSRRESFGKIVGDNSDYIYFTAEDPQFENVTDICKDIIKYVENDKLKYEIIEDRKEAVEKAILNAEPSDVVVLLAKGEEDYQKVEGKYIPYESDLKIAKRLLNIK